MQTRLSEKVLFLAILPVTFYLLLVTHCYAQETLTITTYYPSPYGNYQELRAQRMAIGQNYINRSVVCWDPPCSGVDISDNAGLNRNTDLIVEGNVGIGTPNPFGNINVPAGGGPVTGLHIHSTLGLGMVNISGIGSGVTHNNNYSGISLSDNTGDVYTNSWVIGHAAEIGTALENDLQVGRWINPATYRNDIAIDSATGNVGMGSNNPFGNNIVPAGLGPVTGLDVYSSTGLGTVNIGGIAGGGGVNTYSALCLSSDTGNMFNNSWAIGHSKLQNDNLTIVRWLPTGTSKQDVSIDAATGNVGIGKDTPTYRLHILGSYGVMAAGIDNSVALEASGINDAVGISYFNTNKSKWAYMGLAGADTNWGFNVKAGDFSIGVRGGGDLNFVTDPDLIQNGNETTKMIIKNSGNVGIGILTPQRPFVVRGDTTGQRHTASFFNATNTYGLAIGGQAGTNAGIIQAATFDANGDGVIMSVPLILQQASGNVGIGIDPGAYKLYVNGSGYLNAAAWVYPSDRRLKNNINYIESGLNVIEQLKPAQFDYIKGEKRQVGFIAQEVQKVLPDTIITGNDGMLGMKTESLIPYLVRAVQEQQAEIRSLKQEIKELKHKTAK